MHSVWKLHVTHAWTGALRQRLRNDTFGRRRGSNPLPFDPVFMGLEEAIADFAAAALIVIGKAASV